MLVEVTWTIASIKQNANVKFEWNRSEIWLRIWVTCLASDEIKEFKCEEVFIAHDCWNGNAVDCGIYCQSVKEVAFAQD